MPDKKVITEKFNDLSYGMTCFIVEQIRSKHTIINPIVIKEGVVIIKYYKEEPISRI